MVLAFRARLEVRRVLTQQHPPGLCTVTIYDPLFDAQDRALVARLDMALPKENQVSMRRSPVRGIYPGPPDACVHAEMPPRAVRSAAACQLGCSAAWWAGAVWQRSGCVRGAGHVPCDGPCRYVRRLTQRPSGTGTHCRRVTRHHPARSMQWYTRFSMRWMSRPSWLVAHGGHVSPRDVGDVGAARRVRHLRRARRRCPSRRPMHPPFGCCRAARLRATRCLRRPSTHHSVCTGSINKVGAWMIKTGSVQAGHVHSTVRA